MTVVVAGTSAPELAERLAGTVDAEIETVPSADQLSRRLDAGRTVHTVVLGPEVELSRAVDLAELLRVPRPEVGVVLLRRRLEAEMLTEALRAGVREVVPTGDFASLAAAVHRSEALGDALLSRQGPRPEEGGQRGTVVTVFSAKGGCGKTTMTTNLGAALADRGRRSVVIVDLDLAFGDVAIAMQLFPTRTIADAASLGEESLDFAALQALLTPHSPGLTTLVAPVSPGAAESIPASLVTRIIEILREHFDVVVVDTPPAFDDQVLAAFDLSDVMVLLATLDIPALKNLKLTLETLDLLNYPRELWRIALNRADSKVGLSVSEVEKTLRTPITAQIPSSRDVPASINKGVPLMLDDPRHPVSLSIKEFAETSVIPQSPGASPFDRVTNRDSARAERRGLLRRRSRLG